MPLHSDIKLLRTAFEDIIGVLGKTGSRAIINDLESRGVYSRDSEYLDLALVGDSLERFFGRNTAELLLEQSVKRSRELNVTGIFP